MDDNNNNFNEQNNNNFNQPQMNQQQFNQQQYNQQQYNQQQFNQQQFNQQQYSNAQYGQPIYYQPNQPKQLLPVTEVLNYILMVLNPLATVVAWIMTSLMMNFLADAIVSDINGSGDFNSVGAIFGPEAAALYFVLTAIGIATLVLTIIDIIKMYKANYSIGGLIAFAILLRPGYFIWRRHLQKKPMTFPIIYTVGYAVLDIAYFIAMFYMMFNTIFSTVVYM